MNVWRDFWRGEMDADLRDRALELQRTMQSRNADRRPAGRLESSAVQSALPGRRTASDKSGASRLYRRLREDGMI